MHRPQDVTPSPRKRAATLGLVLVACFAPSMAVAQVPCGGNLPYTQRQLLVQSRYVEYYASHDLGAYNPDVKRAVIFVHGLHGDARDTYDALHGSKCVAERLGWAPEATRETILIAPHFLSDREDDFVVPSDHHYWHGASWEGGYHSEVSPTVSSFSVMDAFIGQLTAPRSLRGLTRRFPNLQMIVVAGFSGGGQLAHRYAATNNREGNLSGIQMRYVVASPSSYLYLDNRRPYSDESEGVGVPYVCAGFPCTWYPRPGFYSAPMCPLSYNQWKYGLEDLNNYAGAVGVATIRQRLTSRNVIVLIGTEDNTDSNDLDTSCPAMLQGPNRYDRAHRLIDYLDERFPTHRHWLIEVVGAHHDIREMIHQPDGFAGTGSLVLFADFLP
jgi:pimeloyl-ACP methyl ester carboxylesterase